MCRRDIVNDWMFEIKQRLKSRLHGGCMLRSRNIVKWKKMKKQNIPGLTEANHRGKSYWFLINLFSKLHYFNLAFIFNMVSSSLLVHNCRENLVTISKLQFTPLYWSVALSKLPTLFDEWFKQYGENIHSTLVSGERWKAVIQCYSAHVVLTLHSQL